MSHNLRLDKNQENKKNAVAADSPNFEQEGIASAMPPKQLFREEEEIHKEELHESNEKSHADTGGDDEIPPNVSNNSGQENNQSSLQFKHQGTTTDQKQIHKRFVPTNLTSSQFKQVDSYQLPLQKGALSVQRMETSQEVSTPENLAENQPNIVDDNIESLAENQLHKSSFIEALLNNVNQIAAEADIPIFARGILNSKINNLFQGLRQKNAEQLNQLVNRRGKPNSAQDAIVLLTQRVRSAVGQLQNAGDSPEQIREMASSQLAGLGLESNDEAVQLKSKSGISVDSDPDQIRSNLNDGSPLPSTQRQKMESAFGTNFSDVKVHTDSDAAQLSSSMNAKAFAVGNDVAFGSGEYKPGTIEGDALIAHELAHVRQQKNATPLKSNMGSSKRQSLEKNADRSAVSVVAQMWGRTKEVFSGLKDMMTPGESAPVMTSTCSADIVTDERVLEIAERSREREGEPALPETYSTEQLIYMLDQLNGEVETYDNLQRAETVAICSAGNNDLSGIHTANQLIDGSRRLDDTISNDQDTFQDDISFHELETMFLIRFKEEGVSQANQLLDLSQGIVEGSRAQETSDLITAIAPMRSNSTRLQELKEQRRERAIQVGGYGALGDSRLLALDAEIEEIYNDAKEHMESIKFQFPILADPDLQEDHALSQLITGDEAIVEALITGIIEERLENIQDTRDGLEDDSSRIFTLPQIVALTKQNLGMVEGSMADQIVDDKISDMGRNTLFINVAIAALGIGLGLVSGGTGTVAVMAAMGGLTLSGFVFAQSLDNYMFETAASSSAFDRAMAVSQSDPSIIWLALDLVGVVGDLVAVTRIFKAVGASAKVAATAAGTADELEAAVRIARSAGNATEEGGEVVADAVRAAIVQERTRNAALNSAANAGALRLIDGVSGLDDIARHGLLQMDDAIRAKILAQFASDPTVVQRIGQFAEVSPAFSRTVADLGTAFNDDIFKAIMQTYMRQGNGQTILQAIHSAGIGVDELRAINFGRASSESGYYTKFRDAINDLIAGRVGQNLDTAADLNRAIGDMNPSQQRAIITRFLENNSGLPADFVTAITGSPNLRNVLKQHSFNTEQLLDWWNTWRVSPNGTFDDFVEAASNIPFNRRTSQTLTDFFTGVTGLTTRQRHLRILSSTEPRLAAAIENVSGGLPSNLRTRLLEIINDDSLIGTATTLKGARRKIGRELRGAIVRMTDNPADLQRILALINEPGTRGKIGEAFFHFHLAGPATQADNLAQVRFLPDEVPGLTVNPFIPDRIRPTARRAVEIKTGYTNSDIDVPQLRNYDRLRAESQIAGSAAQNRVNEILGTSGNTSGLSGVDYLFLSGGQGTSRAAAERALRLIAGENVGNVRVLFLGDDGVIYQLVTGGRGYRTVAIGTRLPD